MKEVKIKHVSSESESKRLDRLLWEVLWKPIGLPRNFRKSLKLEGRCVELIAMDDSSVVGGLVANWYSPYSIELRHLAVKPEAQGQSVGRQLVKELIAIVSEQNCSVIRTIARNTSAGFFQKLGFIRRPGHSLQHPAFKKQGTTFELLEYPCGNLEPPDPRNKR